MSMESGPRKTEIGMTLDDMPQKSRRTGFPQQEAVACLRFRRAALIRSMV